jgi:hypothetical protein
LSQPAWEYDLVDDLQEHQTQRYTTAASRGYRSALRVPIRLEDRYAGALVFFSFERAKYTHADVMVARRIADPRHPGVGARSQRSATKRAEETVARAAKLEARVRALTDELDTRTWSPPRDRRVSELASGAAAGDASSRDRHDRSAAR